MFSYILLGLIVSFPLVIGLFWRVGAPHLFFSLMAGELLARYFGHEAGFLGKDIAGYVEPIIVLLPIILTAIFLRKSITAGRTLLHIIPLLITGFILAVFLLPIMPDYAQDIATQSEAGKYILEFNAPIIGIVVISQLVYLWIINRRQQKHARTE